MDDLEKRILQNSAKLDQNIAELEELAAEAKRCQLPHAKPSDWSIKMMKQLRRLNDQLSKELGDCDSGK